MIGAKRFGSGQHKNKRNLVLIEKKFEMPKYLSDLGGNDAVPHENQRDRLVTAVRGFLRSILTVTCCPGLKLSERTSSASMQTFRALPPRRTVLKTKFGRSATIQSIWNW